MNLYKIIVNNLLQMHQAVFKIMYLLMKMQLTPVNFYWGEMLKFSDIFVGLLICLILQYSNFENQICIFFHYFVFHVGNIDCCKARLVESGRKQII